MQFFVNMNYMVKFKTKDEEDVVDISKWYHSISINKRR